MHDYFEILGVSPDARAPEIRRARRRRTSTSHPDVQDGERPADTSRTAPLTPADSDAAIDFVEIAPLVDRMRAAFFVEP